MTAPLDPLQTAPFTLGTEDGRKVLLVHGFTGSPWDMRPLGEALAAAGFWVRGIRLPGHGTTPEAMQEVGAADWLVAVEQALLELSEEGPVCLAGLSMGALLSICAAAKHPGKVRALAALAPAVHFSDPLFKLVERTRAFGLVGVLKPWIRKSSTDLEDAWQRAQAPILPRYPSARLRDLLTVRDEAVQRMGQVRCPTLLLAAENDHVVSLTGVRQLSTGLRQAQSVRLVRLRRGFHIIPRDLDRALAAQEVVDLFRA